MAPHLQPGAGERGSPRLARTVAPPVTSTHPVLHPSIRPRRGFVAAPPGVTAASPRSCTHKALHWEVEEVVVVEVEVGGGGAILRKMFHTKTPHVVAHQYVLRETMRNNTSGRDRTSLKFQQVSKRAVLVFKVHFENQMDKIV